MKNKYLSLFLIVVFVLLSAASCGEQKESVTKGAKRVSSKEASGKKSTPTPTGKPDDLTPTPVAKPTDIPTPTAAPKVTSTPTPTTVPGKCIKHHFQDGKCTVCLSSWEVYVGNCIMADESAEYDKDEGDYWVEYWEESHFLCEDDSLAYDYYDTDREVLIYYDTMFPNNGMDEHMIVIDFLDLDDDGDYESVGIDFEILQFEEDNFADLFVVLDKSDIREGRLNHELLTDSVIEYYGESGEEEYDEYTTPEELEALRAAGLKPITMDEIINCLLEHWDEYLDIIDEDLQRYDTSLEEANLR